MEPDPPKGEEKKPPPAVAPKIPLPPRFGSLGILAQNRDSGDRLKSIRATPDLTLTKKKEFKPNLTNIPRPPPKPVAPQIKEERAKSREPKGQFTNKKFSPKAPTTSRSQGVVFSAQGGPKRIASAIEDKKEKKPEGGREGDGEGEYVKGQFDPRDPLAPLSFPWEAPDDLPTVPFRHANGDLFGNNELVLMQLPSRLPQNPANFPQSENPAEWSSIGGEHMNGWLGKLVIYESGRAVMRVGEVEFDVTTGQQAQFLQDVHTLDLEEQQCIKLGTIQQRLLCVPNVESILGKNLDLIHVQAGLEENPNPNPS